MITLKEALIFLQSSAGANWVIGFAWSYAVEWIPKFKDWYNKQDPVRKRLVVAGFSLAVPVIAFGFKIVLRYEYLSVDNLWKVLVAWGSAFFGSHVAHTFGPRHPNRLGSGNG